MGLGKAAEGTVCRVAVLVGEGALADAVGEGRLRRGMVLEAAVMVVSWPPLQGYRWYQPTLVRRLLVLGWVVLRGWVLVTLAVTVGTFTG